MPKVSPGSRYRGNRPAKFKNDVKSQLLPTAHERASLDSPAGLTRLECDTQEWGEVQLDGVGKAQPLKCFSMLPTSHPLGIFLSSSETVASVVCFHITFPFLPSPNHHHHHSLPLLRARQWALTVSVQQWISSTSGLTCECSPSVPTPECLHHSLSLFTHTHTPLTIFSQEVES